MDECVADGPQFFVRGSRILKVRAHANEFFTDVPAFGKICHFACQAVRARAISGTPPSGSWAAFAVIGDVQFLPGYSLALGAFLAGLIVSESRFVSSVTFDWRFLEQLADEHFAGLSDHNFWLWILINLEFWYRSFIDGESVDRQQALVDELMA